jgi:hypothetical protein
MTIASTHTGICQACGRRQAVHINTGLLAKHGYTTDHGFFNGTCAGSDHLPLELDTALNIAAVASMLKFAADKAAEAEGEITTVVIEVGPRLHDNRGRSFRQTKSVDRAEFEATQPRYESFDRAVESIRFRLRRTAEIVRAEAAQLDDLRDRVHGQPLQERKVEGDIKREYFRTYREAYARVEELKAAGHKAQQRRGGGKITVTYR